MRLRWILFLIFIFLSACRSHEERISLFPLENYSQTISDWIKPNDTTYDKPIIPITVQQQHMEIFYNHYYGTRSPWDKEHVNRILQLHAPDDLKSVEKDVLNMFNNKHKSANEMGYGENFRPHTGEWIENIANNINVLALDAIPYNENNQAIAVDNLNARALPTDDVDFYSHMIAGQGYPFDNLQISALWAGTPVYIFAETIDHAWMLVLTPDYIAWVKSSGIARVNATFIDTWRTAIKKQWAAITQTKTSIVDQNNRFRFLAYVGAVFPAIETSQGYQLMIPVANNTNQAEINYANVSKDKATLIPIAATPHHFSNIMSTLIGRPYGWGNLYFYNDCSAELKNLFTPFGIWLPRHSSDQVTIGKFVDLSAEPPTQRLAYLKENGRRFMTLIYVGGHIILYIGDYPNPNLANHPLMAMTYQNMWGLSPHPAIRRAVVGQSVLFPLLLHYPEDTSLTSQVSKKYFQLGYIDEIPGTLTTMEIIDLKSLMYPG